jgi:hypothetical protein
VRPAGWRAIGQVHNSHASSRPGQSRPCSRRDARLAGG